MQSEGPDRERSREGAAGHFPGRPGFRIAALPEEEVEKLLHLEEELREDTGHEVVVIAYEREAGTDASEE